MSLAHIRAEAKAGWMGAQLMAIVAEGQRSRLYLPAEAAHEKAADVPRPDDIPTTELPQQALGFRVQGYGMTHHADLFTNRQLIALTTFSCLVMEARDQEVVADGGDEAYADAVATYLAFVVSRLEDISNALCAWKPIVQRPRHLFGRQAIRTAALGRLLAGVCTRHAPGVLREQREGDPRHATEMIITGRLLLHRPALADVPVIIGPSTRRWPSGAGPTRSGGSQAVGLYLIVHRQGRPLGSTGLAVETRWQACVGYVLARDAGGRAYASAATGTTVQQAQAEGLVRLYAVYPRGAPGFRRPCSPRTRVGCLRRARFGWWAARQPANYDDHCW